jgi:F-type H+-transporting ATPase subunit gamma
LATLRQLRTRVASIKNIQRVTNAMQMVSAAKMRRAQEAIGAARPYAEQLDLVLRQLQGSVADDEHPLLAQRPVERIAVAVVTSDRGLCGAFNTNICRLAQSEANSAEDTGVDLVTVGRKGRDYFNNRGYSITQHHADVFADLNFARAADIAADLSQRFLEGEVDRVVLVYSQFRSVAQQVPVVQQLLPIPPAEDTDAGAGDGTSGEYLFEPEPAVLLNQLVPRHVNFQLWRALLESNAGEQAARMTAMDNATKNAGDLIEELTREMNKERQASITLELMDIIGGAEAVA